jgi:hypothetical protein
MFTPHETRIKPADHPVLGNVIRTNRRTWEDFLAARVGP